MALLKRYRVHCTTCGHVATWAESMPTECPNDSQHTLTEGSGVLLRALDLARSQLFPLSGDTAGWWERTDAASWTRVCEFQFHGSEAIGEPVAVQTIVGVSNGYTMGWRIRDKDNNANIAGKTGISGLGVESEDYNLNNIPANEANWEFQVAASDAAATVYAGFFAIIY